MLKPHASDSRQRRQPEPKSVAISVRLFKSTSALQAIRLVAVNFQQERPHTHTKCMTIMQLHSLLFAPSKASDATKRHNMLDLLKLVHS